MKACPHRLLWSAVLQLCSLSKRCWLCFPECVVTDGGLAPSSDSCRALCLHMVLFAVCSYL